jgi:competence protein ComEC
VDGPIKTAAAGGGIIAAMKKWSIIILLTLCATSLSFYFGRPDDYVHISFLDVGQGDAVLIQRGNIQILIDGGPSPQAITNELGRRMPYWDKNIELLVMTHPHQDHLSGLVEVLKRYNIGAVLQPRIQDSEYSTGLAAEWRRLLFEKKTRQITAETYQEISLGGIVLTVLNPYESSDVNSDPDTMAIVLSVDAGGFTFLLTSDIGRETEFDLLYDRLVPDCNVLKVAHHGSSFSTTLEFLNVARPELAVISVGENDYGHPGAEMLHRLEDILVYRTDTRGTIEFIIESEMLWVKTDR